MNKYENGSAIYIALPATKILLKPVTDKLVKTLGIKKAILSGRTLLVIACLLSAGNIVCQAQSPDKIERKQLFDYKLKFYWGDTTAAKSKDFNDSSRLL